MLPSQARDVLLQNRQPEALKRRPAAGAAIRPAYATGACQSSQTIGPKPKGSK